MFPAHIRETGERQTVQEHCRNTAALAATALRPLGLEKSAYLVGLLHDAGKNKQEYAQYLSEAVSGGNAVRGSVNHTFAGVRLLLDRWHGGCGTFSYCCCPMAFITNIPVFPWRPVPVIFRRCSA